MVAAEQRHRRVLQMDAGEVDAFLHEQRTARFASTDAAGHPHVTPVWFVWDGSAVWVSSLLRSQRWSDVAGNAAVALVCDAGETYGELRGVEITGTATVVGEVPRSDEPNDAVSDAERRFEQKYLGRPMRHEGKHGWLCIRPALVVSWDHRKLPAPPVESISRPNRPR
ncbi:MAG: pyridoxamine 5-phosphate oxidase [Subtercola sp.]|nr:pyridoxamine 5-phosphate oxidase [Subtercola sp.]